LDVLLSNSAERIFVQPLCYQRHTVVWGCRQLGCVCACAVVRDKLSLPGWLGSLLAHMAIGRAHWMTLLVRQGPLRWPEHLVTKLAAAGIAVHPWLALDAFDEPPRSCNWPGPAIWLGCWQGTNRWMAVLNLVGCWASPTLVVGGRFGPHPVFAALEWPATGWNFLKPNAISVAAWHLAQAASIQAIVENVMLSSGTVSYGVCWPTRA